MAAIHVAQLLSHPAVRSAIERALAARGVHGDTQLVHVDPREEAMLRFMGGAGTINPRTGLRQFFVGGVGGGGDSGAGIGPGGAAGGDTQTGAQASAGGGVGGYGQADRGAGGSGLGAAGGHSGEGGYYSPYGIRGSAASAAPAPAPYVPPAPINNMPAPAPVSLTPMMSSTATTDLAASRFGALPSWATTPYQVGMAPSSYPTPGVNAALGAPGMGGRAPVGVGAALPGGTNLGGGGALPGSTLPGGQGVTPVTNIPIQTSTGTISNPVVHTPQGVGVQLPSGVVALLNYQRPGMGGGPTLPNGMNLSQYLANVRMGYTPQMPTQPVGQVPTQQQYVQQVEQKAGLIPQAASQPTVAQATPHIVQQVQQPVASRLTTASQAAPGAIQQLHPAVQQALTRGILGGNLQIQTPAQKVAAQRLLSQTTSRRNR